MAIGKMECYRRTVIGDNMDGFTSSVDLHQDIRSFGRTYFQDGILWFNWSAAGFSLRFTGTKIIAQFHSNAPQTSDYAYLNVWIDGKPQPDLLLDQPQMRVILASQLDAAIPHTLTVRKRTNARASSAGISSLLICNGKAEAPPEIKSPLIEFIGDSLTVGYVASDFGPEADAWSTATEDVSHTYCPAVAQAFGAEYQVVAISGRGIVRNNGGDTDKLFPEIYGQLDLYNWPGREYSFSSQPDLLVVNLGSNDESDANRSLPVQEFQQGTASFLRSLRQKHPNSYILYTYGLQRNTLCQPIREIIEDFKAQNDSKISFFQFRQCSASELHLNHPVSSAYRARIGELVQAIQQLTGWEQKLSI